MSIAICGSLEQAQGNPENRLNNNILYNKTKNNNMSQQHPHTTQTQPKNKKLDTHQQKQTNQN
jgi:hypothetical protein